MHTQIANVSGYKNEEKDYRLIRIIVKSNNNLILHLEFGDNNEEKVHNQQMVNKLRQYKMLNLFPAKILQLKKESGCLRVARPGTDTLETNTYNYNSCNSHANEHNKSVFRWQT